MSEKGSAQNRRKSERIDARIKVQFRTAKEFSACYTQNLSKGGIYLETPELPDPNATIELDLILPDSVANRDSQAIRITGRVVRLMTVVVDNRTIHKVAIQFVDLQPQIQLQIDRLYETLSIKAPF